MRFLVKSTAAIALALAPIAGFAVSCTSQAELGSLDRDALTAVTGRLTGAVLSQNYSALQAELLPEEASAWGGIRAAVEQGQPLLKNGQFQIRNLYLLDATDQTAPQTTQFFCSNASGSLTVTITMNELPPGRYAVVIADAQGSSMAGQMGMVLAWDGAATAWKLAGLTLRPGVRWARRRLVLGARTRTGQGRSMERVVQL